MKMISSLAAMLALTAAAQAQEAAPPPAVPASLYADGLSLNRLQSIIYASDQPAAPAPVASDADDSEQLAKKLSNPVARLISLPLQFNYDHGSGKGDGYQLLLNVQPVIPIALNDNLNLIIRTIVPIVYQDSAGPSGGDSKFGLGDINQSFFFSPNEPTRGGWIYGFGPVFLWPTATDDSLGSQKWGAGPTGLVLKQEGGWTYGVLANHIWSYAGDSDRGNVNVTFLEPFLSYTWKTGTTLGVNTESTYDWNHEQWTMPINIALSQLVKLGNQPVQFSIGGRYYAEGPTGGPEWGLRFAVTYLFPK